MVVWGEGSADESEPPQPAASASVTASRAVTTGGNTAQR
jgi:hypothetical protein